MIEEIKNCFVCGSQNPIGLRLSFNHCAEGRAQASFELPHVFQGYPGYAHGGIIASLLDESMAHALMARGLMAVTGKLQIRFIKPVPLEEPLVVEGYIINKKQGRRGIRLAARIVNNKGETLATGEALFVDQTEKLERD